MIALLQKLFNVAQDFFLQKTLVPVESIVTEVTVLTVVTVVIVVT